MSPIGFEVEEPLQPPEPGKDLALRKDTEIAGLQDGNVAKRESDAPIHQPRSSSPTPKRTTTGGRTVPPGIVGSSSYSSRLPKETIPPRSQSTSGKRFRKKLSYLPWNRRRGRRNGPDSSVAAHATSQWRPPGQELSHRAPLEHGFTGTCGEARSIDRAVLRLTVRTLSNVSLGLDADTGSHLAAAARRKMPGIDMRALSSLAMTPKDNCISVVALADLANGAIAAGTAVDADAIGNLANSLFGERTGVALEALSSLSSRLSRWLESIGAPEIGILRDIGGRFRSPTGGSIAAHVDFIVDGINAYQYIGLNLLARDLTELHRTAWSGASEDVNSELGHLRTGIVSRAQSQDYFADVIFSLIFVLILWLTVSAVESVNPDLAANASALALIAEAGQNVAQAARISALGLYDTVYPGS
jgi:hypothetical protein